MKGISKKAFTLVELLIVIVILSILWTLTFLSFSSYSMSARDAIRIGDINNIENVMDSYQINLGYSPLPTNWLDVTFSWSQAWYQWTVWDSVLRVLDKITWELRDPLTWNEYAFSRTSRKDEYEVAAVLEGSMPRAQLINSANAATGESEKVWTTYIKWNYNWQVIKVYSWSTTYVLAVPTIISSDMDLTDVIDLLNSNSLAYSTSNNLPDSYKNTVFKMKWDILYEPGDVLVYEWDLFDLYKDELKRIDMMKKLKLAYSNFTLKDDSIDKLTSTDLDSLKSTTREYINSNTENIIALNATFVDDPFVDEMIELNDVVSPIVCWSENWTFENVDDWFLISDSCLFSQTWWDFIVNDWEGESSTKWLKNESNTESTLYYTVTLWQPAKLNFDYKTSISSPLWDGYAFYINDTRYDFLKTSTSWYEEYETPLLAPWTYTFKWNIKRYWAGWNFAYLWLDNIWFTCARWWAWCWWEDWSLDTWSEDPWDLFTFTKPSWLTWLQDFDSYSEWSWSIVNIWYTDTTLTKTVVFSEPKKFKFDYRTNITSIWSIGFYINDTQFIRATAWNTGLFNTFESPLLPAWTYTFKWNIDRDDAWGNNYAFLWLDNMEYTCVWWWTWCWWTDGTFEIWAEDPWDLFTFVKPSKIPWLLDTDSTEWTYAMKNVDGDSTLTRTVTLTSPSTIQYDYKAQVSWLGRIDFYIWSTRYFRKTSGSYPYTTYTSPTLSPWTYTLKWALDKQSWSTQYARFWIDDFKIVP